MIRRAFVVRGRVQGVGFRWFVQRTARERGTTGWVRNESDGSVAGEVGGDPAAVAAFLDDLRRGPRLARVEELLVTDVPGVPAAEDGFSIR